MIETPTLSAMLADVAGDDPTLLAELRGAFLESAAVQRMRLATLDPGAWSDAALRLASLAASFGAVDLLGCASAAMEAAPSAALLDRVDLELARLRG